MKINERAARYGANRLNSVSVRWLLVGQVLLACLSSKGTAPVVDAAPTNAAAPFRAMIIHPVGQFDYHTHDFDYGLEKNSISYRHYGVDNLDAIRAEFAQYDLVMFTPLVNLNDVFAGTEDAVRAWIGRGNALVVTDGCDGRLYNPWLATVAGVTDPAEDACPCGSVGIVKHQFVLDTDPPHPLRSFPDKLDFEALQWNALKSVSGWETVATCSGSSPTHPVTAMRPLGRGCSIFPPCNSGGAHCPPISSPICACAARASRPFLIR